MAVAVSGAAGRFVREPALGDEFRDVCLAGGDFGGAGGEVARVVVGADDVEVDVGVVAGEGDGAAVEGELFGAAAVDFGAADDDRCDAQGFVEDGANHAVVEIAEVDGVGPV